LVNKPEICDELVSTSTIIFKDQISDEETQKMILENKKIEMAKKNKFENDKFENDVHEFIKNFNNIHNREPTYDEIIDNLGDKISMEILTKILNRMLTLNVINKV
jgi:transcription termination factor NusB